MAIFPSYLCSCGSVNDKSDIQTDVFEDGLDILEVTKVQSADGWKHRHGEMASMSADSIKDENDDAFIVYEEE